MSLIDIFSTIVNVDFGGVMATAQDGAEALKDFSKSMGDASDALKDFAKSGMVTDEAKNTFLGMPIFEKDFYKLLFRFSLNLVVVLIIGRYLYYPVAKRKDYLFTYLMISVITFFICFALKKFDLELGAAMGLFAIFGIIRYRTNPIPIKEMTYLFVIIGVSVINALANKKMSYAELMFANAIIIAILIGLEKVWLLKHEARKNIVFEKIELIKPENYELLKADIEDRTGLKINRVEVGKIDFLRDVANVRIYYYEDEQLTPQLDNHETQD